MRSQCQDCGRPVVRHIGEYVDGTLLRWSESYVCEACGCAIEADGIGPFPEDVRQALLAEGAWELRVFGEGRDVVRALMVLRRELGLSVSEAGALRVQLSGPVLTGTRGEMERLRRLLMAEGVAASVGPVAAG